MMSRITLSFRVCASVPNALSLVTRSDLRSSRTFCNSSATLDNPQLRHAVTNSSTVHIPLACANPTKLRGANFGFDPERLVDDTCEPASSETERLEFVLATPWRALRALLLFTDPLPFADGDGVPSASLSLTSKVARSSNAALSLEYDSDLDMPP